ncbi:MAG: NADH-quinone oxidoreductase subunit N [Bryobacteraceae bacterium]|nr:NADH-quinone oxidoreductase subunit N [Bryobacteraceae bacterium]
MLPTSAELMRFAPEIVLSILGTLLMVLEPLTGDERGVKPSLRFLALAGLALALAASVLALGDPGPAFNGMLQVDAYGGFFRALVIVVGILTVLAAESYLRREKHETGEFYALVVFSIAGQCVMVTANELIVLFIGLEISSISSYILAGFLRDDKRANESALKYFLLGSFATGFLLYGIAWIYGLTGSTNLQTIQQTLSAGSTNTVLVGLAAALMFVGFSFKVSAAPFQVWAPDVYQGAPAPVSAFLSAGPKAAAFAMFVRVFLTAFGSLAAQWENLLWLSALATMVIGNFAALQQSNIKRLLAYSSIAHAGYVLVAITAHSNVGTQAVMFYLASYAFVNIGAFAVVSHVARQGERHVAVEDFAGLAARQPITAFLLTVFLASLIGVPLTGGFFGKFYIFKAALDANLVWLTVLGLINSAVAAYYYLRIIMVMYTKQPSEATAQLEPLELTTKALLWVSAVATILLGVFPSMLLSWAGDSARLVK